MKRFLSVLLVAILIVTSLSTVAFAATEVKTGDVKTFTVTVSGDEFTDFKANLSSDAGLKITNVSGPVTVNSSNSAVSYANSANVTSVSFEVTVEVTATAPGTYNVYASVAYANKYVGDENDTDGVADGWIASAASCGGASFVIVCDHAWSDWTVVSEADCENDGLKTRTCSKCGEVEEVKINALGHNLVWKYDSENHWHVCSKCGKDANDLAKHTMSDEEFNYQDNKYHSHCTAGCGYEKTRTPSGPIDPSEPETGDITPMFTAAVAAMIAMVCAVIYLFKRRAVK